MCRDVCFVGLQLIAHVYGVCFPQEVLAATVNAIQRGGLPYAMLSNPVPAPAYVGCSPSQQSGAGGGCNCTDASHGDCGLAAECTALLQRVCVAKPELASSLPRTSAEVRLKHGRAISE